MTDNPPPRDWWDKFNDFWHEWSKHMIQYRLMHDPYMICKSVEEQMDGNYDKYYDNKTLSETKWSEFWQS